MNRRPGCGCGASGRLVFACSGAADVGAVTDRAAREADRILAIDGCEEVCAKKNLERAGLRDCLAIGTVIFAVTTLAGNWTATWFHLMGGGLFRRGASPGA